MSRKHYSTKLFYKYYMDWIKLYNEKAVRNRTLSDGTKKKFGETLIQHEVRVLMTRGVNGMYIYACDPELQAALLAAAKEREEL